MEKLVIYDIHLANTTKNGKYIISLEKKKKIAAKVSTYWRGREKSALEITIEVEIFQSLVTRTLKEK